MELEINKQVEVNEKQFNWVRAYCTGLLAYRKASEGKFYVKPLVFMGHKKQIEDSLAKLEKDEK